MNCCNDYGECTQGKNCPIRCTRCEPEEHTASPFEQIAYWFPLALSVFLSMLLIAALIGYEMFISGWMDFLLPTK